MESNFNMDCQRCKEDGYMCLDCYIAFMEEKIIKAEYLLASLNGELARVKELKSRKKA